MEEERGEGRRDEEERAQAITEERHVQEMQGGNDMAERHRSLVEDFTGDEKSRKRQSTEFTQPRQRHRRIEATSIPCFEKTIVEAIEKMLLIFCPLIFFPR
ncbi:hypothetical protein Q7C36_003716 [Tachysurus vachellii]|uniref:Uncharacterized protein n=1 Tax=Tachysurus vachellii TaxID=175792 RepID=A0AA88NVH6_TACVA|nr:hypothetical protein Q7C36_003716 [Tachysurus vachellii]